MAGDDDKKKKKKKSKKEEKEEAPPPPEPEPEPAPAPPAAGDDGEDDWLSAAVEDTADGEAPAEPPAEGEFPPAEGEEGGAPIEGEEPPPQPKKKPKFFVHWDRKKSRFYDYNFDYGENYYKPVVKYMDNKSLSSSGLEMPRRMAFAERGMRSALERHSTADYRTESVLSDVRSSIRGLELSQKNYMWEHVKNTY